MYNLGTLGIFRSDQRVLQPLLLRHSVEIINSGVALPPQPSGKPPRRGQGRSPGPAHQNKRHNKNDGDSCDFHGNKKHENGSNGSSGIV